MVQNGWDSGMYKQKNCVVVMITIWSDDNGEILDWLKLHEKIL